MMRRILYYGTLVSQVVILIVIAWQFDASLSKGKEMTIMTTSSPQGSEYTYELIDDYYSEFEINYIDRELLDKTPERNETVYVLLAKEDHIYQVKNASMQKMEQKEDDILLQGKYQYEDNRTNNLYVEYGFERVEKIDQYGKFTSQDQLQMTFIYAKKWNQFRIKDISKIN